MLLGAIVDAGAPVGTINSELNLLDVGKLSITVKTGQRKSVTGTQAFVEFDDSSQPAKRIVDFIEIVKRSQLHPNVVDKACAVFCRLGEAEAAVHGVPKHNNQLHEVGDLDTLADVVGSIVGLEILGVERIYSSVLPTGSGVINTAHGLMPVPSLATSKLFEMSKAPILPPPTNYVTGEMVTPTGAAIVTTLASFSRPLMNLETVGYGLGNRDPRNYPNVLAIWLGEEDEDLLETPLVVIETNIDDMSGEVFGYIHERLFDLGALDVWFLPIQMKKNRPGTMLNVLVPVDLESSAISFILRETSSMGVRVKQVVRHEAQREILDVKTDLGIVPVKIKILNGERISVSPEYDVCRSIAVENGMPIRDVYRIVEVEARKTLLQD